MVITYRKAGNENHILLTSNLVLWFWLYKMVPKSHPKGTLQGHVKTYKLIIIDLF